MALATSKASSFQDEYEHVSSQKVPSTRSTRSKQMKKSPFWKWKNTKDLVKEPNTMPEKNWEDQNNRWLFT